MHRSYVVWIVVLLVVISCAMVLFLNELVQNVAISLTAIVGAVAIWFEMKRAKDMAEGEFVVNLNNSFSSNCDAKCLFEKMIAKKELVEKDRAAIVECLTFFETVHILIKRNVVELDIIDDLFSYRFFSTANNKDVQDLELIKDDIYYKNIYRLYNEWYNYREKNGLWPEGTTNTLKERNPNYDKLIK